MPMQQLHAGAAGMLPLRPVSCLQGALQQNLVADKDVTLAARRVLEARWADCRV